MALSANYNFRNVFVRWRATVATVLGVALVVAVYVLVQALAVGLEKSASNTGDPRNVMIVRKGSTAESSSQVSRVQFQTIEFLPQIARDEKDRPLVSADVVVLISLPRRDSNGEANVTMRGITAIGHEIAAAGEARGRQLVHAGQTRSRRQRENGGALRQFPARPEIQDRRARTHRRRPVRRRQQRVRFRGLDGRRRGARAVRPRELFQRARPRRPARRRRRN